MEREHVTEGNLENVQDLNSLHFNKQFHPQSTKILQINELYVDLNMSKLKRKTLERFPLMSVFAYLSAYLVN